ncbi:MAG: hypothetical protein HY898_23800 [Deltaproteobacteria bacterium]|nr:hypothetical protein [Deltaproteobacteria bacterium]
MKRWAGFFVILVSFACVVSGCCGKKSSSGAQNAATEVCKSMPGPATCETCCHKQGAASHVHTHANGCRCF